MKCGRRAWIAAGHHRARPLMRPQPHRLQGELATAEEAAVLDKKIEELCRKARQGSGSARAANPQAEVIVRLMHLAREDAEAWYALLFALAVEAAAMSVLLIAERDRRSSARIRQAVRPRRRWRFYLLRGYAWKHAIL